MSLARFIEAQDRIWPTPLDEIAAGRKMSHWMWFVFPQLRGLGQSPTALLFGIADLQEAQAYLADLTLGPRLIEISQTLLRHVGTPARAILGPVDTLKLRSCMTLFEAAGGPPDFAQVLDGFYAGQRCDATHQILSADRP